MSDSFQDVPADGRSDSSHNVHLDEMNGSIQAGPWVGMNFSSCHGSALMKSSKELNMEWDVSEKKVRITLYIQLPNSFF